MRGLIIGGDARFPELIRLLAKDGHEFFPMAIEKVLPVEGPPDYLRADTVILPLPAEREGWLNTPLSAGKYKFAELLAPLRPGTVVFAGMAGEGLQQFCRERGLMLKDYFLSEELQVKNALLTAEGAVGLMLGLDGESLRGRRVLISGFGRIARLLTPRLMALGMAVTVAARSSAQRAWAEVMGCEAVKPGNCLCKEWDFVVNTVPAPIFGEEELTAFGGAELIELASAPYGFDRSAAEKLGKRINMAPGLPSIWAPRSAAEAIRDAIYSILEE